MTVVNHLGKGKLGFTSYIYERTESQGVYSIKVAPLVTKLPPIIKVEENQEKGKVRTKYILRGKFKTWSKTILTGLLPTDNSEIYTGDYFNKGKKSFLLIRTSKDKNRIEILFFNGFMPLFPAMRDQLARAYFGQKRTL